MAGAVRKKADSFTAAKRMARTSAETQTTGATMETIL